MEYQTMQDCRFCQDAILDNPRLLENGKWIIDANKRKGQPLYHWLGLCGFTVCSGNGVYLRLRDIYK